MKAHAPAPPGLESLSQKRRRMEAIFSGLNQAYPGTALALNFSSPLELLIALILAAQCTDERVNAVTANVFKKYQTAMAWAGADRRALERDLQSVSFYRNKTKAIQACCQELVDRFGGEVPKTLEELVSLPGVGRKTANVLRGNAFGQPAIGVDRHVGRLAQRMGFTTETDPDKIELDLNALVPDERKVRFCHLMQTHGRVQCLARTPQCDTCPVRSSCPYPT
ncbi:MAG: endonuclease III [Nitrospirota bacterium]|jgi:endonuclease-3|nr:endonuclease III [Nitrospirota bacterium]